MSRKVKSSGYSKTNDDSSDELPYKDHKNRNRSKHKHRSDSAERTYDDYAESGREKSSRDRSRWEEKKSYHRDNNRDREQTTSKYQDDRREDQNRSRQSDRPGSSQQQYRRDAQPSGSRDSQGGRDNYRRRSRSPFKPPTDRRPPSAPNQDRRDRPKMGRANIKEEKNKSDGEGNDHQWGKRRDDKVKQEQQDEDAPPVEKQKPDFGLSGKLTEETNKVNGVVIAYSEPPGARKPKRRWRLYPFKGEQALPTLYIHRQSCYLIGRDRKVCDLPVDHPSCSKQHAVLQYRLVPYELVDGTKSQRVRPYIIDLDSTNGTFVNNKKIDPKRYYELHEKDVLKFAFSSREYVLLHENSKEDNEEDEGLDASPAGKDRPAGVSVKEEEK
ncbi:smad nuclear-interacting protein 1 [Anopheles gambiae]|uniref:smad nuclear-interacting protein 1 n=1 Tax=Anopheles gambiae TaxID=7165 RepID=UPI002AC9955C|nr:smad nuclear-interacting protein 1 [Anopheles gambiae]